MGVEHSKGCLPMRMSKKIPIAGAPTPSVERRLWQIACQWVWNLRLTLGKMMQGGELREMEWAPPTETAPLCFTWEDPPEEYGPWQCAGEAGRAVGRFTADAFTLQQDGKLRCPAGASLWLSEVRQENAFTQRAVSPFLPDRLPPMCSARAVSGPKSQRQSCSSCQCGPSSLASARLRGAKTCQAWTNALGGCGRASASPYLDDSLASAIR
jgi:hypothetical protein